MNSSGFILLYRQITEWEWYQNPNTFRVFLHCLLMANFTDGRFEGMDIKRGQFVTSLPNLSKQTKLSIQQVRTALDHLKSTGEITDTSTSKYRVITVVKYNDYQQDNRQNNSQSTGNQQASNRQVTGNQQQYKKNNNDNNEKKEKEILLFDRFWSVYPRHVNKQGAMKAFDKLKVDEELLEKMITAVERQKKSEQWSRDNGQYIPHPATWLNQHRWEDEITPASQYNPNSAHNFTERDYSGVDAQLKMQLAKEMEEYRNGEGA